MPRLATIVTVVSDASLEIGIIQKALVNVIGTADQDIAQMLALMQNVADELMLDPPYRDEFGDGNWVCDAAGLVFKARPTLDDDLVMFDARLAINGLKYRFLKAK